MSIINDIERFADELGDDAEALAHKVLEQVRREAVEHPEHVFALLRALRPVLVTKKIAVVSRYDDVVEVLEHDEAFSVSEYGEKMRALAGDFILGRDDSAAYEREVSILRLAAPRSDIPGLAGFAASEAERIVAEAQGQLDLVDFASRVPVRLVERWFGTPGPDEKTQIEWACAMFADIFLNQQDDAELHAAAERAGVAMRSHLDSVIAARKASGEIGDDVLGRLISMQADPDTAFTDEEIRTNFIGLIVGFIPTVMSATTLAVNALLERPDALAQACEAARTDDDETLRACMWEAMRLGPMAAGVIRRTAVDYVVAEGTHHATRIPAGTLTLAATQSAMLDGDVIDDPSDFKTDRPPHHYLHFGAGMHECFGRFANAMQIPAIAKAVLRQPGVKRAPGAEGKLERNDQYPTRLLVGFDAG
ncbi:MAG: cytochrome P450 [Solirubrobacterales bacterium]